MNLSGKTVLAQLERDILPLQGYKSPPTENYIPIGFVPIENAFPNARFPRGCLHEFINLSAEEASAAQGFIAGLLSRLMQRGGVCVYISASRMLFPYALHRYGIAPHQVIFIDLKREKDVLQAAEQALQCHHLTAVLCEASSISFTESRRLQLAAERSRVTGFVMRHVPAYKANTIACLSRWYITSVSSRFEDDMPGVGFPRWQVELQKVRNGKPGQWIIEWSPEGFTEIKDDVISIAAGGKRKMV